VFVSPLMQKSPPAPAPTVVFDKHIPANAQPWEIPEVWVVVPSADGQRALSATNEGQILYWSIGDGTPMNPPTILGTYKSSEEWVGGLAFIPATGGGAETQFVSSHADGKVCVWNLGGPNPHVVPANTFSHGNDKPVNSVAVTRDGGRIVSGGFDKTVCIWDRSLPDTQIPKRFGAHTKWVWRVALSPNDDKIASAGEDGTIRICGLDGVGFKNGAVDAVLPTPEPAGTMGVAFVDQNTVVYTTDKTAGNQVKLWPIGAFTHP